MITYIISGLLIMAILYAIYKLVFEKEAMFQFNRLFILFSIIASFIIPLLPDHFEHSFINSFENLFLASENLNESHSTNFISDHLDDYIGLVLMTIYIFLSTLLFIRNLLFLYNFIRKNTVLQFKGAYLVLLEEKPYHIHFSSIYFYQNKNLKIQKWKTFW